MPTRMLDTNVVSFFVRQHSLAAMYRPLIAGYQPAISFQTYAELYFGAAWANWGLHRRAILDGVLFGMAVFHSNPAVCDRWTDVRMARRRQPIAIPDAWIAATALAYGVELVTHDPADFAGVPGLVVVTAGP